MIFLRNIWRLTAPVLIILLFLPIFASPALADDIAARVRIKSRCKDQGCEIKMTSSAENKIKVLSNYDSFVSLGLLKRHRHFEDFLPPIVYAREISITDRNNPENVFTFKNSLDLPSNEKINEANVLVSAAFWGQVSGNIYLNQNIAVSLDSGNKVIAINSGGSSLSESGIDFNLR